jgi:nitrate reductase alpha subunit
VRGLGGFVRSNWDEVNEMIAAANVYTIKKYGPDRVIGFSPIPAMSMVSYAAGSRYLSLIGGVCMSFYDWYCDLPPPARRSGASRPTCRSRPTGTTHLHHCLGLQRAADAHAGCALLHRGALQGHQDGGGHAGLLRGGQAVRHLDEPQAGHRRGGGDGHGPRDPEGVLLPGWRQAAAAYFDDYVRRYTDMPMLVMLKEHSCRAGETVMVPDRYVRASDFNGKLGQANNPEWKTVAFDESGKVVLPNGAIGFRWGPDGRADEGQWNLEAKEARHGNEVKLKLSVMEGQDPARKRPRSASPISAASSANTSRTMPRGDASNNVLVRTVPVQRISLGKEGEKREALVATVFDLQVANYGVARGLPGEMAAKDFDDDTPYTPAWQERITGTPREQLITVARQFADNADKTHGKSMVIIGAAMNHWYHAT